MLPASLVLATAHEFGAKIWTQDSGRIPFRVLCLDAFVAIFNSLDLKSILMHIEIDI